MARTLRIHTRTKHKKQAIVEPELWNSARACESLAGLLPRVAETFHPPAGTIVSLAQWDRSRPTLKRVAGCAVEPQRSQRRGCTWTGCAKCGSRATCKMRDPVTTTMDYHYGVYLRRCDGCALPLLE